MRAAEREAAWLKQMQRVGEQMASLEERRTQGVPEGAHLVGFSARLATKERPEALLVLRATGDAGKFVAFIGALTLEQAILVWRAKVQIGGVRWRKDLPYVGHTDGEGG